MNKYRIKEKGDWYFVQVRCLLFFWYDLVGYWGLEEAKARIDRLIVEDYAEAIYHDYP